MMFMFNLNILAMANKRLVYDFFENEVIEKLKQTTGSKKINFNLDDCYRLKRLALDREKLIIEVLSYLNSNPLKDNDYFKFVNAYYETRTKLNEKYFRHDVQKLHEYYSKIDNNGFRSNPFNRANYESYVLFMALKLHGQYQSDDDEIFNVKKQDSREYTPLTNIPSVLRGTLPFKVKEYDIKRAFPTFIDIELNTDFRNNVYDVITKQEFAIYLNSNHTGKLTLSDARKGLEPIYKELVTKVLTDERYNEKGSVFKDFTKYENDFINRFVSENKLTHYARLHDGVFVLDEVVCDVLKFDIVEFSIKESIKPAIANDVISFYDLDSKGKVYTSPASYSDFLKQEKFIRLQTHDDKIQLLKNTNNVVDFFNHKTDMVSFLESEINEADSFNVRNKIAQDNNNTLQQSFTLLEPIKLKYHKDTKNSFGLPFQNGFFYFDGLNDFQIKRKEYFEVNGFFTPHRIQNRNFEYTDETSVFEIFLNRIVTGQKEPCINTFSDDLSAFHSMFGYLCHNHKTLTENPCIVLTDEGANDETRNGGRGKTIIGLALKEVTKVMQKSGLEFKGEYTHNFADLDESFNVFLLDDIPAGFNFNDLYTNITGGINIQPKGTKARLIEFNDSPKFIITTNFLLRYDENDTSTNRRFIEYKIKPYYGIENTPKKEFGHTFFEDWDSDEWNRFYSFVFRCVKHYLTHGIIRIHYDKKEDNYRALFNSDARETEMKRIMDELINPKPVFGSTTITPVESFSVSEFLDIYNQYDNKLKNEKLFNHINTKRFINAYLDNNQLLNFKYEQNCKRWFMVKQ